MNISCIFVRLDYSLIPYIAIYINISTPLVPDVVDMYIIR